MSNLFDDKYIKYIVLYTYNTDDHFCLPTLQNSKTREPTGGGQRGHFPQRNF